MTDNSSATPITRGSASVNGAALYYETTGSGYPLVLVHRGLLDHQMWDDQFAALGEHYYVIRYDIRGSGSSRVGTGDFSHHGDLHGLLRALNVERAHLVGLGLGASISLDFALSYPEQVSALVLVSPGLGGFQASAAFKEYQHQLFIAFSRMNSDETVDLSLKMWVDGPTRTSDEVDPRMRARVRAMMTDAMMRPPQNYLAKMLDPLAITRLNDLKTPALVLAGALDISDTLDIADKIDTGIAGAEKVLFPDAGHMLNMEQPDRFNRLVLDFLAAHTPPDTSG